MEQNQIVSSPVSPVVSFGEWLLTLFLMVIPIVNIVLLFIWAFSTDTNPSKANWAKASLIVMATGIFFYVIIMLVGLVIWRPWS